MPEVYADHAATTPPAPEVVAAMQPFLAGAFGNPSSVHARGERARDAIERARARVAALIGALPEELVFTASGSEANALALQGALGAAPETRRRLVVSAIEHPSVLENAHWLETRGLALTVLPVGADGIVDLEHAARAIGPDVALVSVMAVNNEVGTVQPIAELARLAHAAGAKFHCDAVQAAGKRPIDVAAWDVDLLTLAGHKFEGPLGAAALYVRRRTRIVPLLHGGHQERSRRAGTENLPAIVGLGVAAERACTWLAGADAHLPDRLGARLAAGLTHAVPDTRVNGAPGVTAIVNLCFSGVDGEALLHALDARGITVSTGSACSAADPGPSHVLLAMGLRPEDAHASVRFSFGRTSTAVDVDSILEHTPSEVGRLRALSGRSLQTGT